MIEFLTEITKENFNHIVSKSKRTLKDVEYDYISIVDSTLSCLIKVIGNNTVTKSYIVQTFVIFKLSRNAITKYLNKIHEISMSFAKLKNVITVFLKSIEGVVK